MTNKTIITNNLIIKWKVLFLYVCVQYYWINVWNVIFFEQMWSQSFGKSLNRNGISLLNFYLTNKLLVSQKKLLSVGFRSLLFVIMNCIFWTRIEPKKCSIHRQINNVDFIFGFLCAFQNAQGNCSIHKNKIDHK